MPQHYTQTAQLYPSLVSADLVEVPSPFARVTVFRNLALKIAGVVLVLGLD